MGSSYPIKVSQLLNKKSGIRIVTKTNGCLGLMIKSNYHGWNFIISIIKSNNKLSFMIAFFLIMICLVQNSNIWARLELQVICLTLLWCYMLNVQGDLYDHRSLVRAIKEVDVVISTVGHHLLADQDKIIAAIKEAGNIKVIYK